ncbi:MAG: rhodanese-like domain-containing protein [Synechococcaceae bacterium WB9_2_112]|nr:rhodanese-like domain-containing protein [Synechococcaceae bacterium WB9_2_112]
MGYEHGVADSSFDADFGGSLQSHVFAPAQLVRALTVREAKRLLWEGVRLLDARSVQEHGSYHIPSALQLNHQASNRQLMLRCPDRNEPLLCYSNAERRARILVSRLQQLGYRHAYVLQAGLEGFNPTQGD